MENQVANSTGAVASKITVEQELRRSVLACMLWEDVAYQNGVAVAQHIVNLIPQVSPEFAQKLAVEARNEQKLRHVPLLIVKTMAGLQTHKHLVASTLYQIIQRPDEITEFLSLYWSNGKKPISNQIKKGLASAFTKFDEYQLAKYATGTKSAIKLRDALFLTHPKPLDSKQEDLWKKLANNELASPDTWEVEISSSKDKLASWTRLLKENRLGAVALLRNLRNLQLANVPNAMISDAIKAMNPSKLLPYQFISAWEFAPAFASELEAKMLECFNAGEKLKGKTVVAIDLSGSMRSPLSSKSRMSRFDAAVALAILLKGSSEECVLYGTAGKDFNRIATTKKLGYSGGGFNLKRELTSLNGEVGSGGIFLKQCTDYIGALEKDVDTYIVITDSQDTSGDDSPKRTIPFGKKNYMMDISCHKHGVGYENFTVLNGFSEALVKYVIEEQKL